MPLVEIKDFNALINNKPFFDQSVKSKQEAYGKVIEMSRNDDGTFIYIYIYIKRKLLIKLRFTD